MYNTGPNTETSHNTLPFKCCTQLYIQYLKKRFVHSTIFAIQKVKIEGR